MKSESEGRAHMKQEPEPESESESEPEPEPGSEPKPEPESESEGRAHMKQESEQESESEGRAHMKQESEPEPESEPVVLEQMGCLDYITICVLFGPSQPFVLTGATKEERRDTLIAEMHAPFYEKKKPHPPAPGRYTRHILELSSGKSTANTIEPREFAVVFSEYLDTHIQKGVISFNPLTVLIYSIKLQQYGLSQGEFNHAIENSNHASLFDWEEKMDFHIRQLCGVSRSQDLYDETTNDEYIDWRESDKTVVEDTLYLYRREFKYTRQVFDIISAERKKRLSRAYSFVWVCKNPGCLPVDLVKFIVGFVKDG